MGWIGLDSGVLEELVVGCFCSGIYVLEGVVDGEAVDGAGVVAE